MDVTATIYDTTGHDLWHDWIGNGTCGQALGPVALPAAGHTSSR